MNIESLYNKIKDLKVYDDEKKMEILKELQTEIITNGKVNAGIKSAFNRVIKGLEYRPLLQKINKTDDDTYCLCDGYKMIEWKNKYGIPKQLLVEVEEEKNSCSNIYYSKLKPQFDMETAKIKVDDLKKMINYNKTRDDKRIPYVIENKVFIDAQYLYDLLVLAEFKGQEVEIEYSTEKVNTPVIKEFGHCNLLLLPIIVGDKEEVIKINNEVLKGAE